MTPPKRSIAGEETSMIIVLVEVGVKDGASAAVRDAVSRMEQATRKEPGCISYAFSTDISDPNTVRVTERWKSVDALREHMAAPHMAQFQKDVMSLQPTSLAVKAYEAQEIDMPH
jgi:quinol monooxygenase YgiN